MEFPMPQTAELWLGKTMESLRRCNELSVRFGLTLSDAQMEVLARQRLEALQDAGRVELGEGILPALILAFCDSPYLFQETYEETLAELQSAFYYFKTATEDRMPDDELIALLRRYFDNTAQGSLDHLASATPDELLRGEDCPDEFRRPR